MGDSTTKVSGVDEDQLPLPENSTAMANPQQTDQMDVDSRSDSTPPQPKKPIASLVKKCESAALKQLSDAIDKHETESRYCCGGRVSTALNKKIRWEALDVLESDSDPRFSPPDLNRYILRFDDPVDKEISRQVIFPMKKGNLKEAWSQFVTATQLSEGLGFLSPKQFSIDFDPHRSGLLDVVEQIMLPGINCDALKSRPEHRGIRASPPTLLVRLIPNLKDSF
jgi:hypothetical protein